MVINRDIREKYLKIYLEQLSVVLSFKKKNFLNKIKKSNCE